MNIPDPVRLYRIGYIDNLDVLLRRNALHAPHYAPDDGLEYHMIHDASIQSIRYNRQISVGAGGSVHDYLPFYLGPWSPMLFKLSRGGVDGYNEGQAPLIYIVAWASEVWQAGLPFVFSDGHGIAAYTEWYDSFSDLDRLDWSVVLSKDWADTEDDGDRKRRKQAEFLIQHSLPWNMVRGIAVFNDEMADRVSTILDQYPDRHKPPVRVVPSWYY